MADPMPESRRERKKRELRERIYDCGARLFLESGFDGTTVEQIAEAADVAQATFFNHFATKDALLTEMTGEVYRVIEALLGEQRKSPASTREKLQQMTQVASKLIEETRELTRDILLALMRDTGRPGAAGPLLHDVLDAFAEFISDGQTRGDVRKDHDARFLAEMMVGVFHSTIANWIHEPDYPLSDRLSRAAEFIGEAIAPNRGGG